MAILDSKGRLFGKINLLDIGAVLVVVLVLFGVFVFPGTSGSVAQVNLKTVPIEADLIVRGLNVRDLQQLSEYGFKSNGKTNIIIRNQPHGQIGIKEVKQLPRTLMVPQPNGSLKELPDIRANSFSTDLLLTLQGNAQLTDNGPVLGNSKIKIGMPIELEGFNYNFNGTVIDLRMKDNKDK
jgi:Domain of unknown function (DUF4330)